MITFTLNDGSKVSLDDVAEIDVTVQNAVASPDLLCDCMYRIYTLAKQIASSFPVAIAYEDVDRNSAVLEFRRGILEGMREHSFIFDEGDAYEQDAEG